MAIGNMVGASVQRHEDPKLITGAGNYVDDIKLPGMLYVGIVHSPYAHAEDYQRGHEPLKASKWVNAVLTGQEVRARQKLPAPHHLGDPARPKDPRPLGHGDRRGPLCGRARRRRGGRRPLPGGRRSRPDQSRLRAAARRDRAGSRPGRRRAARPRGAGHQPGLLLSRPPPAISTPRSPTPKSWSSSAWSTSASPPSRSRRAASWPSTTRR